MFYFAQNNAKQCGPCLRGTSAMSQVLDRLTAGPATSDDLTRLDGWGSSLRGRGACGYLDGAAALPGTLMREFAEHVAAHRWPSCPSATLAGEGRLDWLRFPLAG